MSAPLPVQLPRVRAGDLYRVKSITGDLIATGRIADPVYHDGVLVSVAVNEPRDGWGQLVPDTLTVPATCTVITHR